MSKQQPKKPTADFVQKQIDEVRGNPQFVSEREALSKLLEKFPLNQHLEDVILKATVVNSIYNTRIFGIYSVARRIVDLKIDSQLESKSPEVVENIAHVTFEVDKMQIHKYFYAFATKYCSWHKPDDYPRYDSFVSRLLVSYRKKDDFDRFTLSDLKHYARYKEIIEQFRNHYQLTQFNFDELDQFLWWYGQKWSSSQ